MINLKEAIKITKITEKETFYMKKEGTGKHDGKFFTLKEIKNQYDMKNTIVTSIQPRFSFYGDYEGIEFEIK